jgi:hypothetical protein
MKTMEQIVARVTASTSFLGFDREVLVPYLKFDLARPFLKPEAIREEWFPLSLVREDVLKEMREYMAESGWDKARNHRGISANRSTEKMEAWDWLLSDDGQELDFEKIPYANYGCPQLAAVCRKYGFPIPETEDVQRMIKGLPCTPDCQMGCG